MGTAMAGTVSRAARFGLAVLALGIGACDGVPANPMDSQIEIIDWWTANGETEAISALLTYFQQQYPSETPLPMPIATSQAARATIRTLMNGGQPPDTFQANGGWDLLAWVVSNDADATASRMAPIDPDAEGWGSQIPKEVLSTVCLNGSNGPCYGVPLDIHRENTLFYNTALLPSFAETPPTSLDGLFAAAAALKASGTPFPIALGTADNTLPILFFENLLVARQGSTFYLSFMQGKGQPYAPEIATAVDDLETLLSYANTNAADLIWSVAAERVLTGDAALIIMGDWVKAYMLHSSSTVVEYVPVPGGPGPPGPSSGLVAFGAIPMPSPDGTFVFTTDTFGLPFGAPNPMGTIDLLTTFGSSTAQDIFNPLKGSISPRTDSERALYDPMSQQTITDFRNPSTPRVAATAILAPPDFMNVVNQALVTFVANRNKSVLIDTIANYYDMLQNSPLPLL